MFEELYNKAISEISEDRLHQNLLYCLRDTSNYYSMARFLEPFLFSVNDASLNIFWKSLHGSTKYIEPALVYGVMKSSSTHPNLRKLLELVVYRYA